MCIRDRGSSLRQGQLVESRDVGADARNGILGIEVETARRIVLAGPLRAQASVDGLNGGDHDEQVGRSIVRRALEEPIRQIADNGGYEPGVVVDKVRQGERAFGFNAATGVYEDLLEAGIPDPAKVTRSTVQNAASIAGLLLTTSALVAEHKEETPPPGGDHGHPGGAPGMDF